MQFLIENGFQIENPSFDFKLFKYQKVSSFDFLRPCVPTLATIFSHDAWQIGGRRGIQDWIRIFRIPPLDTSSWKALHWRTHRSSHNEPNDHNRPSLGVSSQCRDQLSTFLEIWSPVIRCKWSILRWVKSAQNSWPNSLLRGRFAGGLPWKFLSPLINQHSQHPSFLLQHAWVAPLHTAFHASNSTWTTYDLSCPCRLASKPTAVLWNPCHVSTLASLQLRFAPCQPLWLPELSWSQLCPR